MVLIKIALKLNNGHQVGIVEHFSFSFIHLTQYVGALYFGVIPKIDAKTSPCSAKQVASSAGGLLAVWAVCSTTSTPTVNFVCCPSAVERAAYETWIGRLDFTHSKAAGKARLSMLNGFDQNRLEAE